MKRQEQEEDPANTGVFCATMRHNRHIAALLLGANSIGDEGAKAVAELVEAQSNESKLSTVFLGRTTNRCASCG